MLTETFEYGYSISPDGSVSIRRDTIIKRDGIELSRVAHRHVRQPGEDISDEPVEVQAVLTATWNALNL